MAQHEQSPGPGAPDVPAPLERALTDATRQVADLEAELAAIGESTEARPDDEHDAEGSTVGYERARVGSLLARATRARDDAQAAADRVRAGTYGRCADCGATIADDRLAALPATRRCTDCARRAERGGSGTRRAERGGSGTRRAERGGSGTRRADRRPG